MNILGKVLDKVTLHAITSTPAIHTLDKAAESLEESVRNRRAKLFEKESGTEILVFERRSSTESYKLSESLVDRFNIYDENQELKYSVKGELLSKKRHLMVYDACGMNVGLLKEKLFTFRGLLSFETSPVDFSLEIYGKKLGDIKSIGGIVNRKFKIGFNDWNIKGNVFSGKYSVVNKKEEIARIIKRSGSYVLTFFEKHNELVLLMIVIALYSDSARDKSDIREHNRERKIRKVKFWLGK